MRSLTKEAKASWTLFIVSWIVYAIICMTRSAFSSTIASITREHILNKADAGIINAFFYLFYGGMQLACLKVIDKIPPIRLINMALLGTLITMVGMSLSTSFLPMFLLWGFCGLMQFAVWPAVLRLISEYLLPQHQGAARLAIAFSYCTGTLANYLLAAFALGIGRWPLLFQIFAGILVVTIIVWVLVTRKTIPKLSGVTEAPLPRAAAEPKKQASIGVIPLMASSGLIFLLFTGFCRTSLDSGLKSWVPTMIVENYSSVSDSFANVLTTVLVCVNLTGAFIATWLYPRRIKSAVWALTTCFVMAIPFIIVLLWTGSIPVALVVAALTIVTTLMYAGHQLINILIPSRFSKYGKEGSVGAVLNAFASFGAVAASFTFGFLSEHYGWQVTISSWLILAVAAVLFTSLAAPLWKRFFRSKGETL